MGLLLYPYFLLVFWYRDFLGGSVKKSLSLFIYISELLSVPLLLKTFFKPLKNEYREGLVLFSILSGIVVKSLVLSVSAVILFLAFAMLLVLNLLILGMPILLARVYLLYGAL